MTPLDISLDILNTTEFYDRRVFRVGWTLIPNMRATQMIVSWMPLWCKNLGDDEESRWRKRFAEALRDGVVAEVGDCRDWRKAEGHYLQCWRLLQEVEPPEQRSSNETWTRQGVYDWCCMCVGTRLISVYQQYAHNFAKALAVIAWLQRRQPGPDYHQQAAADAEASVPYEPSQDPSLPLRRWWGQLLQHKALLLFHRGWAEEVAGNVVDALRLHNAALECIHDTAPEPLPARVILSGSLACIAGNSGSMDEARLWMRTMSCYWTRDRARFGSKWERAVDCVLIGSFNDRWASILSSNFHGSQRLFLLFPAGGILPRSPLRFDQSVHQFYRQQSFFPAVYRVASCVQGTFDLSETDLRIAGGDHFANWNEKLMAHIKEGRAADENENWEKAISSYLVCKEMILELAASLPQTVHYYRATAMLTGTQLAYLYQWRTHDLQQCAATLDWLLSMVELPEVSPQLLLHRSQVKYQLEIHEDQDGHNAVEHLGKIMDLAVNPSSPAPDRCLLSAILCLGLAGSSALIDPLETSKWLKRAFQNIQYLSWPFGWQVSFRQQALEICLDMKDFTGVREHALNLIRILEGKTSGHLEVNVHWLLLSRCCCMALDACFLMDGYDSAGKTSSKVGLHWDVEAGNLEKGLRDKVTDLMNELEKRHHVIKVDDYDQSQHLAEVELTPEGVSMMGYRLSRCLGEAISRANPSKGSRMKSEDHTALLAYVHAEISFAKRMLPPDTEDGAPHQDGWHWLIGLSYTKLGELLEWDVDLHGDARDNATKTKLDALKRTYEAATDHLFRVPQHYMLDGHLVKLLGFKYHACSSPEDLDHHIFCALSGIARALGLTLLLQPCSGVVSEMDTFLKAVARAETYTRLPRQAISAQFAAHQDAKRSRILNDRRLAQTFYDDLLVKIIEKRELRANVQSSWSRVLDIRRLALCQFYQTVDHGSLPPHKYQPYITLLSDSLSWLEQGLSTLYSFQWLRFYSKNRSLYYSQVWQCWPEAPRPGSAQEASIFWNFICECRQFCRTQNPPISQLYYQFSKGHITIFLMAEEDAVKIIEPPMSSENVEEILTRFYEKRKKAEDPRELLTLLYDILIKPISRSLIKGSKVIFIAEQILANVPFAILLNGETGKYLFEQCTVSVVPSALALWHCMKRYATSLNSGEPLRPALMVADPAYSDLKKFPRLPHSAEEVRAVQRIFNQESSNGGGTVLQVETRIGVEATVKAVLEAVESPGRSRPFIHLAVHAGTEPKRIPRTDPGKLQFRAIKQGTIYLADPLVREWPPAGEESRSCTGERVQSTDHGEILVVDDDDDDDDDEDEQTIRAIKNKKTDKGKSSKKEWQLRADDDILGREKAWNVDMVVLSACKSSKGQVLESGSYLNLPRALTIAGAPCIVAAQWPVEDAGSTVTLMQHFYQGMKDGLDASTALQCSMKKMLDVGHFSVYQFGAFMVWGLPIVCLPKPAVSNNV